MKSNKGLILGFVLACLAMVACSPCEVGDWYRDGDLQGVVLQLNDDNEPTLLLLADEIRDVNADSALAWAAALDAQASYSCALPTKEEVELIRKYKMLISVSCYTHGISCMHTSFIWRVRFCVDIYLYVLLVLDCEGEEGLACYCYSCCACSSCYQGK